MENNTEWVSVSELASRLKVSKQTIYNRLKDGIYEFQSFNRGKYHGFLIKYDCKNGG